MAEDNAPRAPDAVIFAATLHPHRSLSARGRAMLLGAFALLSLGVGAYVFAKGAWPVVGFVGLDVAAVALALHLNQRGARAREEVRVSRAAIIVTRVAASGAAQELRLNPLGVRLEVDRAPGEGVTRIALRLRERRIPVGAFLNPDDRASFARALGVALAQARA